MMTILHQDHALSVRVLLRCWLHPFGVSEVVNDPHLVALVSRKLGSNVVSLVIAEHCDCVRSTVERGLMFVGEVNDPLVGQRSKILLRHREKCPAR